MKIGIMYTFLAMPIFNLSGKGKKNLNYSSGLLPWGRHKLLQKGNQGDLASIGSWKEIKPLHPEKDTPCSAAYFFCGDREDKDQLQMIPGQVSRGVGKTFCLTMSMSQSVLSWQVY